MTVLQIVHLDRLQIPVARMKNCQEWRARRASVTCNLTQFTILVNMEHMAQAPDVSSSRRNLILNAAICVFGRFGFKKTSVEDLAAAAQISKQGLYLHFPSKEAVFMGAMQKYLDDGLALVQEELTRPDTPLFKQLLGAMDAWFGRHFVTFSPAAFDVIEAGQHLSGNRVEEYKAAFQARLAKALADSTQFERATNVCTPKELAQVLFLCGLSWKFGHASRADFMKKMAVCVRACCQVEG
jgi:TetR/AcrR family transcriptional regulator, regulator of autoinduction and epiphytic fitness